uniref:Small ribosomal subunit protein RACK1 n=1 Tax=Timema tahoe TaxID=61484 RepID=A0A7R9IDB3_9NEOP|nr:unnamed protein product [Timema tahoe]
MTESLHLQGTLKGHNGWVTQIATNPNYSDMVLSSSRDRSLILWKLSRSEHNLGLPQKRLLGHNHFVSDIAISSDGHFALSGSWDRSLRLWDLGQGTSTRQFVDHKKDVMSVAFSADNRQIVSGSRDKSLKLWNTLAHCKFTMQDEGHADWVSCVRFSPNIQNPIIVSCGWDKKVKVWSLTNCKVRTDHAGHSGCLNSVTISPDGSLCASGGQLSPSLLGWMDYNQHASSQKSLFFCENWQTQIRHALLANSPFVATGLPDPALVNGAINMSCVTRFGGCMCLSPWARGLVPQPLGPRGLVPQPLGPRGLVPQPLGPRGLMPQPLGPKGLLPQPISPRVLVPQPPGPRYLVPQPPSLRAYELLVPLFQDSKVMLWDLNEDKHLYTLENKDVINALCFSPNRYWLCAAVGPYIKIWDLEGKLVIDELCPEVVSQYSGRDTEPPQCLCMSWSGDGQTLFAGYSDSIIRAWQVIASPSSS